MQDLLTVLTAGLLLEIQSSLTPSWFKNFDRTGAECASRNSKRLLSSPIQFAAEYFLDRESDDVTLRAV